MSVQGFKTARVSVGVASQDEVGVKQIVRKLVFRSNCASEGADTTPPFLRFDRAIL